LMVLPCLLLTPRNPSVEILLHMLQQQGNVFGIFWSVCRNVDCCIVENVSLGFLKIFVTLSLPIPWPGIHHLCVIHPLDKYYKIPFRKFRGKRLTPEEDDTIFKLLPARRLICHFLLFQIILKKRAWWDEDMQDLWLSMLTRGRGNVCHQCWWRGWC
jgi:hypothetical protein